jgi:hypothetical protein
MPRQEFCNHCGHKIDPVVGGDGKTVVAWRCGLCLEKAPPGGIVGEAAEVRQARLDRERRADAARKREATRAANREQLPIPGTERKW